VGLSVLLSREPDFEVVGEAADLANAVSSMTWFLPDVVIVASPDDEPCSSADLRLLIDGGTGDPSKVLAIVPELDQAARCWQMAGARGVLDNQATPEQIVAAVRMVAAGYRLTVPPCKGDDHTPERPANTVRAGSSEQDLESSGITRRERDVLELIIRGYSNAEISEALFLSESTVKSHVQRMLEKLALRNRVHAVIYAYEKGIVRAGETSTQP